MKQPQLMCTKLKWISYPAIFVFILSLNFSVNANAQSTGVIESPKYDSGSSTKKKRTYKRTYKKKETEAQKKAKADAKRKKELLKGLKELEKKADKLCKKDKKEKQLTACMGAREAIAIAACRDDLTKDFCTAATKKHYAAKKKECEFRSKYNKKKVKRVYIIDSYPSKVTSAFFKNLRNHKHESVELVFDFNEKGKFKWAWDSRDHECKQNGNEGMGVFFKATHHKGGGSSEVISSSFDGTLDGMTWAEYKASLGKLQTDYDILKKERDTWYAKIMRSNWSGWVLKAGIAYAGWKTLKGLSKIGGRNRAKILRYTALGSKYFIGSHRLSNIRKFPHWLFMVGFVDYQLVTIAADWVTDYATSKAFGAEKAERMYLFNLLENSMCTATMGKKSYAKDYLDCISDEDLEEVTAGSSATENFDQIIANEKYNEELVKHQDEIDRAMAEKLKAQKQYNKALNEHAKNVKKNDDLRVDGVVVGPDYVKVDEPERTYSVSRIKNAKKAITNFFKKYKRKRVRTDKSDF